MSLPALAVRRPIATTMLLAAAVLLGVVSLARMEVTLLPEVPGEELTVWIPDPEAGVEEIERAVARPAEEVLVTVPGVRDVTTRVVAGGASLRVRLYPGTDSELAALGVREKLEALRWSFPDGVGRPLVSSGAEAERPAMVLALAAEDLPSAAEWARSVLAPRLEQIDGVARVEIEGAPEREIRIDVDTARMAALGVSFAQIESALADADVRSTGGYMRRHGIRYALRVDSELSTPREIGLVVVSGDTERPIRLRDVASVEDGFRDPEGWSRLDGRPAVTVLVHREADANLLRTAGRVHERLAELTAEQPDLALAVVQDPVPFLQQAIGGLWQAVVLGGLLAFGVLLYFLNDVRAPLVVMTALPVSIIVTFVALDALGISLNLMSLGGIALGIGQLVDTSIICLDNVHRLRREGVPPARAAAEGAREVALPMLASTLTTCIVFLPLGWLPGRLGALFRDQALAVCVAQFVSLAATLTVVPLLAARVPPSRRAGRRPFFALYHRLLVACLRRPMAFTAVLVAALAGSTALFLGLPREVLPEVASEDLEWVVRLPAGTDVVATDEAVQELEAWLRARPEVARVHASVGAAGADDPLRGERELNRARLRARLHPSGIAHRERIAAELAEEYRARSAWTLELLPSRPELAAVFFQGEATLTCEVTGSDPELAAATAEALVDAARSAHPELSGALRVVREEAQPRYRYDNDRDAAWRAGVSEADVATALEVNASGREVLRLRRFDEEDPVVLREEQAQVRPAALLSVGDRRLPIEALAEQTLELAPAGLLRTHQARVTQIVWDGSLREVERARRALEEARASIGLPPGVTLRFGGDYEEMRATIAAMGRCFLLSAVLVFLVLAAQFESVRLPLLIFSDIPLAIIGVAVALALAGQSLNALSGVGMVILNGIVVNDSILKVDLLRRLRAEGVGALRAILVTSKRFYRPIWMTTATTVLGLLPLYFGRGAELMSSLATAAIGGLVVSTILTLLVIPVLFLAMERWRGRSGASA